MRLLQTATSDAFYRVAFDGFEFTLGIWYHYN